MKLFQSPSLARPALLALAIVFIIIPCAERAQEKVQEPLPRQIPPKAAQPQPARPAVRPLPQQRPQPQAQQRPTPPQRPVQQRPQARGNPNGGQANQNGGLVNRGGGVYTGQGAGGRQGNQNGGLVNRGGGIYTGQGQGGGVRQAGGGAAGPNASGLRLPPNARAMPMAGGATGIVHPDGRRWVLDQNKHVTAFARPGLQAKFNRDGRLNSVHVERPNNNLIVARNPHGDRQTLAIRPGGVVVATYGRDRGFVQRPIPGRPGYFERTYWMGGRSYARVYRLYRFRGVVYVRYVPAYYYQPRFYQWVDNPWRQQAAYAWGWQQAPWSNFYSTYFTPASSYPGASLWLTDFVLGQNLQSAYQNHRDFEETQEGVAVTPGSGGGSTPINPDVKAQIAQEVQVQVSDEEAASAQQEGQLPVANGQTPPPVLQPNERTFVVSQNVDVGNADSPCALTPGDVIYRSGDNLLPGNKVGINVLASKAGDCPANASTDIDVGTLQEIHNQFHEQVDEGLSTIASGPNQGELPNVPPAGARPVQEGTVQPDSDVASVVAQQQSDADAAEAAATDGANAVGTT